jgi:anti-anti-sigma regulatory factor
MCNRQAVVNTGMNLTVPQSHKFLDSLTGSILRRKLAIVCVEVEHIDDTAVMLMLHNFTAAGSSNHTNRTDTQFS